MRVLAYLSAALMTALVLACRDDEQRDAGDDAAATWTTVHEELAGSLLSVWCEGETVYAVGGDAGDGPEAWALESGSWQRLDTGSHGDLWWLAADPEGELWMVGEGGSILRHERGSANFEAVPSGTTATLWGIWFAPSGQAWSVGGTVMPKEGALLHYDGATWTAEELPGELADLVATRLLYKVWGRGDDDVWAVGEGGLVLHRDASGWTRVESPVETRLFTVHGTAAAGPVMVGGATGPTFVEWDGAELVDRSSELPPSSRGLNGVFMSEDGTVHVVGAYGYLASRDTDGVWSVPDELGTNLGLHAVRQDDRGAVWAVGGEIDLSLTQGVMLHYGVAPPPLP